MPGRDLERDVVDRDDAAEPLGDGVDARSTGSRRRSCREPPVAPHRRRSAASADDTSRYQPTWIGRGQVLGRGRARRRLAAEDEVVHVERHVAHAEQRHPAARCRTRGRPTTLPTTAALTTNAPTMNAAAYARRVVYEATAVASVAK